MSGKLFVSSAPHIAKKESVAKLMWSVNIALVPAGIMSFLVFGAASLRVILVSILAAIVTEAFIQKGRRQKEGILDGSAVMTGLLLAYNLPSELPLWLPAVGSFFAIAIGKQAFGGLGRNIFNPALIGRAFLMAAWPRHMTSFPAPFGLDALTQATPLRLLKEGKLAQLAESGLSRADFFFGSTGGSLGEVCAFVLLLGGLYLLVKKVISWHIPVSFILTVGLFTWIFGGRAGFFKGDFLFHVLSGGLLLGAIYMATDYVTSPFTPRGHLFFGVGCGLLTCVIRLWGGYPEGVCYAILIMNTMVPLIDRFTQRRRYGT